MWNLNLLFGDWGKSKEMGRGPDLINNSNSFPGSSFLPVIYVRDIKWDFLAPKLFLRKLWVGLCCRTSVYWESGKSRLFESRIELKYTCGRYGRENKKRKKWKWKLICLSNIPFCVCWRYRNSVYWMSGGRLIPELNLNRIYMWKLKY